MLPSVRLYCGDALDWVKANKPPLLITDCDKLLYGPLVSIVEDYGGRVLSFYAHIVPGSIHPATKVVDDFEAVIRAISGDTIVDPFMGSGSVGIAAIRLGKNFIGIDKERKWVDLARTRLQSENPTLSIDTLELR